MEGSVLNNQALPWTFTSIAKIPPCQSRSKQKTNRR